MFDDPPVHIGDPETSIRPRADHRRPEPIVARGEELRAFLAAGSAGAEGDPSRLQDDSVDKVVNRLTDKGVAVEAGSEQIVPVDRESIGRGEVVGSVLVVVAGHQSTAGIDPAGVRSDGQGGSGSGEMGVSPHVRVREDKVEHGAGILAAEPVSPVIPGC